MLALVLALALALIPRALLAAPAPSWEGGPEQASTNGALLLSWAAEQPGHALEYELQEATDPGFGDAVTRYRGTFPSWFVSGRPDGTCHFRVRSRPWSRETGDGGEWSEWSASKRVVVRHHDLRLALGLFLIGALVFAATALTLLAGVRRSSESSAPTQPKP